MSFTIITHGLEKYVTEIQKLADQNSSTLGFIPGKAYEQFVHDNRIYCAIDNDRVIAYVLFRYNKKTNKIVLVHVCVDKSYRKSKIAKSLIDTVAVQHPWVRLIEARCRRDYCLDEFWKQCEFHVVDEKSGRSQSGSLLKIWQRRIQTLDLLYLAQKAEASNKLVVVLDTNIIIELCDNPHGNSKCLEDASLSEYITYQVTPECLDEISLKANHEIRQRHLSYASRYPKTPQSPDFDSISSSLQQHFDPTQKHTADIRHLAHCVTGEVDVFVTNDQWVCNHREVFRIEYGVDILHPEELYATIEERFDAKSYISESMGGSQYCDMLLSLEDLKDATELHHEIQIKKKDFESWLRSSFTQSSESIYLIKQSTKVIGLYALKKELHYTKLTQLIISSKKTKASIKDALASAILDRIISRIAKENQQCTALILDRSIITSISALIDKHLIINLHSGGLKLIINAALTASDALSRVNTYLQTIGEDLISTQERNDISNHCQAIINHSPLALERLLSPMILLDSSIPTWIVPIKPQYAVRLFDNDLANTNQSFLHNEHEFAALSSQNSYYTKAKRTFITPCRILWYVSYERSYIGSGTIRACSIMRSAEKGTKKELFTRHQKFGVLSWDEMKNIPPEGIIRVFTFDDTRSLPHPIQLKYLQQVFQDQLNQHIQLVSPNQIPCEIASQLLQSSMEVT